MHELNSIDKWKKSAFLSVLFRGSEKLRTHTEKKTEEKVDESDSALRQYNKFFGVAEENPPEVELVVKSASEASNIHPPISSDRREKDDQPERILGRDSGRYEERRGRSRSSDYGDSRRGSRRDYDDREERYHSKRHHRRSPDRRYRRSPDRRERGFREEYEEYNPRRNSDRSGWKEQSSRNWSESHGHSLDEPLRFTGAHLTCSQPSYDRGLNLSKPDSPFGGSPQGAKRESGYARSESHSPAQTGASGDAGFRAIAPSTLPTVGSLLMTSAVVDEIDADLVNMFTDPDGTVWLRKIPVEKVTAPVDKRFDDKREFLFSASKRGELKCEIMQYDIPGLQSNPEMIEQLDIRNIREKCTLNKQEWHHSKSPVSWCV